MEVAVKNSACFSELKNDEIFDTYGGNVNSYLGARTGIYLANLIMYNIRVAEINGYNDTVTSNGRPDLIKDYPEKPTW